MKPVEEFDYPALLANSIHEVKNSLSLLITSIDQVVEENSQDGCPACRILPQVQSESKRVNDKLVELLAIYRIRVNHYSANIDEYSISDLLHETVMQYESILHNREISCEIECEEDLHWYFDQDLMSGVMSNVINNLFKYTKDKTHISAHIEQGELIIRIKDNGPGYPDEMLITHSESQQSINFDHASTGLGLYFSRLVAELHKNKGRHGYITTTNDGIDGGGCFSIHLP